jgi:integrase
MTTNFVLRQPKAKSATPLNLRLTWKQHSILFSTGIKVNPSYLLENNSRNKDARISNRLENSDILNDSINSRRDKLESSFNRYVSKYGIEPQSTKDFKRFLDSESERIAKEQREEDKKKTTLLDYFEVIAQRNDKRLEALGKLSNRNSISTSYRQTAKVLRAFESDFVSYTVNFDHIDLDFYADFLDYCNEVRMYSVNNTGKHIKNLKTVMKEALEEKLTTNTACLSKRFKVITEEVFNVYLEDHELKALFNADLGGRQEIVRDLFIIGCNTALRISDFNRISKHNITPDHCLKIKTQKTAKTVEIPMNQMLYDTLLKYDFEPPTIEEQTFNKMIKEICEEVGINSIQTYEKTKGGKKVTISKPKFEMVASHTCRRTMSTKCYNEGLDTITIMAMTGHKSEKSFMKYIKATPKDYANRMRQHYLNTGQHLKVV